MDGISWSTPRSQELFSHPTPPSDTLSRLASFIARADIKHHACSQRQPLSQQSMFVCHECHQGFPYTSDLLQHQELKHSLPKPHRCPSCGKGFSLRSSLLLHRCSVVPCELCHGESQRSPHGSSCILHTSDPGRTQDKSLLHQPHRLDHSPYACAPCGRGFSQKQALLHHQQAGCIEPPSLTDTIEANALSEDSPLFSEGDFVRSNCLNNLGSRAINACQMCSRTFRVEARLRHHKQISHTECGLKIKGDQLMKEGKANEDPKKKPKSTAKILCCRSCDMVFQSTAKLYVHRKEKHSREKNLRRESRPVVSKRRRGGVYPCQVCSKVFVHHLSLRAHYRQHTTMSFTSINNRSLTEESRTKNSKLSVKSADAMKPSMVDNESVQAGPRTPRKWSTAEDRLEYSGSCRDRPVVEQAEELDKEFPCPSCPEVFPLHWQLKEHVEFHQSAVRRKQCSVCTSEMDNCKWPNSKRQRLYHCIPCQQGFSALDSFLEHCQEHLRVRVEEDKVAESYMQPDVSL